jgi:hypothetical protein
MPTRAVAVLMIAGALSLAAQSGAPAIDSIRQDDLKADLTFLASDAMQGRLTNTPQNLVAAEFIKARFERLGLAPAVPGYFQNYNLITVTLGQTNALDIVQNATTSQIAHGDGYYTQRFSATGEARGPVVYAGFGIAANEIFTGLHPDYHTFKRRRGSHQLSEDGEDRAARLSDELGSGAGGGKAKAPAA